MFSPSSFEKCLTFISTQLQAPGRAGYMSAEEPQPTITISRQAGAGGIPLAERLAEYLQAHGPTPLRPWTVFDKNLVEQVLADHNLPRELARFMPEDRVSEIHDMVEEELGLHPASWTLMHQTAETILHLAELGNVILVGRAANVITAKLKNVFHVRLVGSLDQRVKLIQSFYKLDPKAARYFTLKEDRARRRYLKKNYHKDIDDPLLYDAIINTDRFSLEDATHLIGDAVLRRFYPAHHQSVHELAHSAA